MDQETPDELVGRQAHGFDLAVVTIVFPLEVDPAVFDVDKTVVGDGHAMSVTANLVEYLLRSGKRTLGVNHPFGALCLGDLPGESAGCAKWFQGAEELQLARIECCLQRFEEEAAEEPGQDPNGQEEVWLAGDPSLTIGCQTAAWHYAVRRSVSSPCSIVGDKTWRFIRICNMSPRSKSQAGLGHLPSYDPWLTPFALHQLIPNEIPKRSPERK
jgi:hypothetical protein